ncbi:unnamed protein product, partial [Vitis vinifera]|uniref:Uncharacterized protein n=1 Tax=Vitis vinifera TaxID=29760 RepID=D7SW12_VITVI
MIVYEVRLDVFFKKYAQVYDSSMFGVDLRSKLEVMCTCFLLVRKGSCSCCYFFLSFSLSSFFEDTCFNFNPFFSGIEAFGSNLML